MPLLINIADIQAYKPLSKGVRTDRVEQFIKEAQDLDFAGLVGRKFYNDLLKNWQAANYQALLTGGDYTYESDSYTFEGLKAVLVYFTWGRLAMFGSITSAPHDFVQKTSDYSDPVSNAQRVATREESAKMANKYWDDCLHFMNANKADYAVYYESQCETGGIYNRGKLKIGKI